MPILLGVAGTVDPPGVEGTGLRAFLAASPVPEPALDSAKDGTQDSLSTLPPARHVLTSSSSDAACSRTAASSATVFLSSAFSSAGDISTLTLALFLIDLARIPKRNVDSVSASLYVAGEQLMMSVVREFPPRDSARQLLHDAAS